MADPSRRSLRRSLLLAVLAVAMFAFALARLRRVARPHFVPLAYYAGGSVVLGRVDIARRGSPGTTVGRTLTCNGREIVSVLANETLTAEDSPVGVRVRTRVRSGVLHPGDCSLQWNAAP